MPPTPASNDHSPRRRKPGKRSAALRLRAVRRVLAGETPSAVAGSLGLDRSSIYPWLKRYKAEGEAGLENKAAYGRTPKLDRETRRNIRLLLRDRPPNALDHNGSFWTTRELAALIQRLFAINPGRSALNHLLKDFGLSNERIHKRSSLRGSLQKEKWLANDYPKILRQAKTQKARVYLVTVNRSSSLVNSIAAAPPGGRLLFLTYRKSVTTADFKRFLHDLMALDDKKLFLILDDTPATKDIAKTKTVTLFLRQHSDRLRVFTPTATTTTPPKKLSKSFQITPSPIPPPPLSDMEAWGLLINRSLLDFRFPFGAFLAAMNNCLFGSCIIVPNVQNPSAPLRPIFQGYTMDEMIDLNRLMIETWHMNPLLIAIEKPTDICTMDDLIPRERWMDNDYCRMQFERADNHYTQMLGMGFAGPDNTVCALLFFRAPMFDVAFTDEEKRFLKRLRPHLETAMELTLAHWKNIFTATALEEATDHLDIATLVLDGNGRIIKSNSAAEEMLKRGENLTQENNHPVFKDPQHQTRFEEMVAKAIHWRQAPTGDKPVEALRLEHGLINQKEQVVGILVQPITPPSYIAPHSTAMAPHVVVYISDSARPRQTPQRQLIMQLFNLSTREAHLTTLLTDGYSLAEAAKAMNITPASARTYLQHIYEKVGVNRQQNLIQQVMKSVALLG